MTITELIGLLQTMDGNIPVLLRGYEGGYHHCGGITDIRSFAKDYYEEWYYGPHEDLEHICDEEKPKSGGTFKAIVLY